jgi:CheY-like chemotaxis protein
VNTDKIPVILMADDDDDDCMLAREAFEACGALGNFACVGDGIELLEYLSRPPLPALILLDISMPLMDGYEAMEKIKKTPSLHSVPIVILTTSQRENIDLERVKEAASFYSKPPTFAEWVDIMKDLANKWLTAG